MKRKRRKNNKFNLIVVLLVFVTILGFISQLIPNTKDNNQVELPNENVTYSLNTEYLYSDGSDTWYYFDGNDRVTELITGDVLIQKLGNYTLTGNSITVEIDGYFTTLTIMEDGSILFPQGNLSYVLSETTKEDLYDYYNSKNDGETGGENEELIDLTGTTWIFDDTITAEAGYGQFQINTLWGEELGSISNSGAGSLCIGYDLDEDTMMPVYKADCFLDSSSLVTSYGSNKVLYITGGNDVTNTDLITWLQKNATQSNIIVFTIDGTIYQAETGMTWSEWCASEYNTNMFAAYDGQVNSSYLLVTVDNVLPTDEIKLKENYTVTRIEL